jgi:hypothetical protein
MFTEHERRVFLGFAIGSTVLFLTGRHPAFLWVAIAFLFARIAPFKVFNVLARKIEGFFKFIGTAISKSILFVLYFILVSPYAILYRYFHREAVQTFLGKKEEGTFYSNTTRVYDHSFFTKPW